MSYKFAAESFHAKKLCSRLFPGMAENAGVDIAGVDNGGVSRRGRDREEDWGLSRFHTVKLSSRVITAQTAQDHLNAYVLCSSEGVRARFH